MKKKPERLLVEKKEDNASWDALSQAIDCLRQGGIVAVPTETYYGLAVDPYNEKALQSLFHLKNRNLQKPILVLIRDVGQLNMIAASVPILYRPLMEKFWPGPLTLIFPGCENLSSLLTGGTGKVGVRISSNLLATQLCREWKKPITATSANFSGEVPAKSAGEVKTMFGSSVDYILDGGTSPGGACSTIVGVTNGKLTLLREGQIAFPSVIESL